MLDGIAELDRLDIPWNQLKSYQAEHPQNTIALENAENLLELRLECQLEDWTPPASISLPKLRNLIASDRHNHTGAVANLLRHLTVPALQHLEVNSNMDVAKCLSSLITQSACSVSILELSATKVRDASLEKLLRAMPQLQRLFLKYKRPSGCNALKVLIYRRDKDIFVAPLLDHIIISGSVPHPSVLEVVESRLPGRRSQLPVGMKDAGGNAVKSLSSLSLQPPNVLDAGVISHFNNFRSATFKFTCGEDSTDSS
jgi:hypothetical protein